MRADAHGRAAGTEHSRAFEAFYASHSGTLRAYASRHLGGRLELDDAMQEGMLRIARDFAGWPPEQRMPYAKRTLHCTVVDGLRRELGTTGERSRILVFDFSELDRPPLPGESVAASKELSDAVSRATSATLTTADDLLERTALLEVLATLDRDERRVLMSIAYEGRTAQEAAVDLDLPLSRVSYLYDEARTHARSLLAHARRAELAGEDRLRLIKLEAGKLTGRTRRRTQRHYDDCDFCGGIEQLERRVSDVPYDGPDRRRRAD